MSLKCIVNAAENWGIGREDQLLVSISQDLKRFRALTTGKTVVLGRRTLAGFPGGRPLKNRENIVLTRGADLPDAVTAHGTTELFRLLRARQNQEVMVIGGESVYRLLLPYCDEVLLTRTFGDYEADRFFPDLDVLENWYIASAEAELEENGVRFQYLSYRNAAPLPLPEEPI